MLLAGFEQQIIGKMEHFEEYSVLGPNVILLDK
jgi:hypothetical protein